METSGVIIDCKPLVLEAYVIKSKCSHHCTVCQGPGEEEKLLIGFCIIFIHSFSKEGAINVRGRLGAGRVGGDGDCSTDQMSSTLQASVTPQH